MKCHRVSSWNDFLLPALRGLGPGERRVDAAEGAFAAGAVARPGSVADDVAAAQPGQAEPAERNRHQGEDDERQPARVVQGHGRNVGER
jgi:hypothetical protein